MGVLAGPQSPVVGKKITIDWHAQLRVEARCYGQVVFGGTFLSSTCVSSQSLSQLRLLRPISSSTVLHNAKSDRVLSGDGLSVDFTVQGALQALWEQRIRLLAAAQILDPDKLPDRAPFLLTDEADKPRAVQILAYANTKIC